MTARGGGSVVLVDGPAAGRFSVTRAPYFLRAVVSVVDGRVDLLDQLGDGPRGDEAVHVYELDAALEHFDPDTWMRQMHAFLCPPPGATATYRHRPDVDGEALRDAPAWRAWARAQPAPVPLVDGATLEPHTGPLTPAIAIDGEAVDVRKLAP